MMPITEYLSRAPSALAVSAFCLLLAACGGGGGGTNTYTIGGTVSGLSGSGLVLQNNGGDDLAVAGVSFTFATALADGSSYDVSVLTQPAGQSCTVANGSGNLTGADVTDVAVTCKGWGTAGLIETDDAGDATKPQIAFDSNGNALAVWAQSVGTRNNVWANYYTAGSGWGTPELIEHDDAGAAQDPQIAFDGSGNALAVWMQYDSTSTRYSIYANYYTAGSGWGNAELIETDDTGAAWYPKIAIDSDGNALAVWEHYGTNDEIWANRYTAGGGGWGTAGLISDPAHGSTAYDTQIAFDSSGNALVVWEQYDDINGFYNILANRYTAGSGWGSAELIETDNTGDAYLPQIAIDGSGNALAVWQQNDGTRNNIVANRYTAGSGWGAAGLIETDNAGHAYDPQIAIDSSGNALAVWAQNDGTYINIQANRYIVGSGWSTPELIETDNAGHAYNPQIAFDGSGNALAVWGQNDGTHINIQANRYIVGSGWSTPELIESDNAGDAIAPRIAVDGNGNALAVWQQFDGTRYNIWANRFE